MTLREFYLERRRAEVPTFMKVLKALPDDRLSYRPHDRSPSAEQIVWTLTRRVESLFGRRDSFQRRVEGGTFSTTARDGRFVRAAVKRTGGYRLQNGRDFVESGCPILLQREGGIGTANRTIPLVHPLRCHSSPRPAFSIPAPDGRYRARYLRPLGRQQVDVTRGFLAFRGGPPCRLDADRESGQRPITSK